MQGSTEINKRTETHTHTDTQTHTQTHTRCSQCTIKLKKQSVTFPWITEGRRERKGKRTGGWEGDEDEGEKGGDDGVTKDKKRGKGGTMGR